MHDFIVPSRFILTHTHNAAGNARPLPWPIFRPVRLDQGKSITASSSLSWDRCSGALQTTRRGTSRRWGVAPCGVFAADEARRCAWLRGVGWRRAGAGRGRGSRTQTGVPTWGWPDGGAQKGEPDGVGQTESLWGRRSASRPWFRWRAMWRNPHRACQTQRRSLAT